MRRAVPAALRRSMATGKDVRLGADGRGLMLEGVDKLADAVQVTLGPKGRNAIIEQPFGKPKITKDGVTVAKSIEFSDRFMNLGAQLVRDVASKTNDVAGDGTTTATVLARAIFAESCKAMSAGMNPIDVQRGARRAVDKVVDVLDGISRPISTKEEIAQVGTISANGEQEIGQLIADAMEVVGKDGVITVQDGKTMHNELETVEGMKFDRGYISPYFITDSKKQVVEFENPLILLVEKKVSSMQALIPVLEKSMQQQRPLLIIAEDVESEALATLVVNKLRANLKVCAVKAPGFGDNRKASLQDMAVLTGATVISEDAGMKMDQINESHLGGAKSVTVTKDDTLILDGAGDSAAIEERGELIRASMEATSSDYEKEKLEERLAKLSGGVAVIKVGGVSDAEVSEKKDRVTDALCAVKCAVKDGIVTGGGTALVWASKELEPLEASEPLLDTRTGIEIIKKAIRAPLRAIANNAGHEGAVVVGEVLKFEDHMQGFDARNGVYTNLLEAGVCDPTLVTRTAIQDAQSVASLLVTAEAFVVEEEKDEPPAPAGGGGMPGMPGMM